MATLKLRKVGNSLGVILPKDMIDRYYLKENDIVQLVEDQEGIRLSPYDPDFAEWAEAYRKTNQRYRNVLRELAK